MLRDLRTHVILNVSFKLCLLFSRQAENQDQQPNYYDTIAVHTYKFYGPPYGWRRMLNAIPTVLIGPANVPTFHMSPYVQPRNTNHKRSKNLCEAR